MPFIEPVRVHHMRILRGLSSRLLPCGCLTGIYETYDNEVVGIIDARGSSCADESHGPGQTLPPQELQAITDYSESPGPRTPPA